MRARAGRAYERGVLGVPRDPVTYPSRAGGQDIHLLAPGVDPKPRGPHLPANLGEVVDERQEGPFNVADPLGFSTNRAPLPIQWSIRALLGRFPVQALSAQCCALRAGTFTNGSTDCPGARARHVVGHVLGERPGHTEDMLPDLPQGRCGHPRSFHSVQFR